MFRKLLRIVAMAALLVSVIGCENQVVVDFREFTVHRDTTIVNSDDAPHYVLDMQLMAAEGPNADAINRSIATQLFDAEDSSLDKAARAFADKTVETYRKDIAPLYRDDRSVAERKQWYEYRYQVNTEVQHARKTICSYVVKTDYYEGGAHGMKQTEVLNFDATTGKQLLLTDFFVSGYEARLAEILLEKLMKQTDCKTLQELRDKGYLYSMDMFASENFLPQDDAFVFIYNPYELAPYEVGQIELKVDEDDLDELLKKED